MNWLNIGEEIYLRRKQVEDYLETKRLYVRERWKC